MAERPKLLNIDTEMQRWCALLGQEISGWPDVSSKPMFGMTAFYHGPNIFAALPKTKAPRTARSLIFKLPGVSDVRLTPGGGPGPGSGWVTFELESSNDINEALVWLERAYETNSV